VGDPQLPSFNFEEAFTPCRLIATLWITSTSPALADEARLVWRNPRALIWAQDERYAAS